MRTYQRSRRTRAWSKSLGLAAAIAGTVFASGAVQVPSAQAGTALQAPVVAGGAGNGIYESPALNYAVPQTFDGTTINWVTGVFDDGGPITGDWDLNFWGSGAGNATFDLFAVDDQGDEIVVDADQKFSLLQSGAVIGPSSTFKDGDQEAAAGWLAGADGYIGFKFNCDGRLANPVAGGVCYGYVHVTTTAPSGFPATIVDYAYDGDGNPITIGPVETFTVTPSVGTPDGTIAPDVAQTVNSGATASFTLTPAAGFHVDNVDGTCGGELAGNVFTTDAVTADCTVIANFAAGEPSPIISVTPSPLAISVDAGATETGTLSVANTGGGTLTYSISEAAAKAAHPRSGRAKLSKRPVVQLAQDTLARAQPQPSLSGRPLPPPVVLGGLTISQMQDNTIGNDGVGCGDNGETDPAAESTADNSWWRRFYFDEHPEVGASANVASVTIGAGQNGSGLVITAMPVTINLYTIPHSTPVDTISRDALTLIGTGTGTIDSGNVTATIPVTGAVDDTVANDLVVEFHVDGNQDGEGFLLPGANTTPQTHPSFLSSDTCGVPDPTSTTELGFDDFHLVMLVTLGEGGGGGSCDSPSDVPWLSVAPASGSLAGGASADSTVTVDASTLAAGSYSANLCVTSNDPASPLVTVPVSVTVEAAPPGSCTTEDTIFCDGFDGEDVGPFEQPVQDPGFEATPGDTEVNPFWTGADSNDSGGGTPFYSTALGQVHTGEFAAWGGGWRMPGTQSWSQSVTIASGGPRFLNYWRLIDAAPDGTATLTISVDGTAVSTTDIVANGVDADWTNVSVDLGSYADDAAHEIKFEYTTTGAEDGNCFVDDITIDETEGSSRR